MKDQLKELEIPMDDFIKQSKKRDGIPVLKAAIIFTNTDESGERAYYQGYRQIGGGFKVVPGESTAEKYVLERAGTIKRADGSSIPVIFRQEVFKDPGVMKKIEDDDSYFFIANRGHSFSDIFEKDSQYYSNNIKRIVLDGACKGFSRVPGYQEHHRESAFFATVGTGMGEINNRNTLSIFNGLEQGSSNYVDLQK